MGDFISVDIGIALPGLKSLRSLYRRGRVLSVLLLRGAYKGIRLCVCLIH
jgi:hypothetical protein